MPPKSAPKEVKSPAEKVEEVKTKEVKPKEVKPKEVKPKEVEEVKTKEVKPKEVKPKETKPKETKPKETKSEEKTKEVAPVVTEVKPEVKPEAAAVPDAATPDTDEDNKRVSDALGLVFPPSRVKLHLNRYVNGAIDAALDELEVEMTGKPDNVELQNKKHALTRCRTRMSDVTPTVLALVLDQLIRDLAQEGFRVAFAENTRTLAIPHLLTASKNVKMASLYTTLGVFLEQSRLAAEKPAEVVKVKRAKKSADESSTETAVVEPVVPEVADLKSEVVPEPTAEQEHEPTDRSRFNSYIAKVFVAVKTSNKDYEKMRVSGDATVFVNDLVVGVIQRLSGMIRVLLEVKAAKTIDEAMVLFAVQLALNDGHEATSTLSYSTVTQKSSGEESKEVLTAHVAVSYVTSAYNNLLKYINEKVAEWREWRANKVTAAAEVAGQKPEPAVTAPQTM
jgi:hypothetical protein